MPRFPSNTFVRFVLIDGIFGATWKLVTTKEHVTLQIEPFVRVSKADRVALEEEGIRLLQTFEPDAKSHSVHVGVASSRPASVRPRATKGLS